MELDERIQRLRIIVQGSNHETIKKMRIRLQQFNNELNSVHERNEYSAIREQNRIKDLLNDFDMKSSRIYQEFLKRGWETLSQQVLKSIAQVFEDRIKIPLSRESKRRKSVLIKWFDDNYDKIYPHLDSIQIVDE